MRVVAMNDIIQELVEWGVPARMEYDSMGDGWVILAGKENEEFLIHHGFKYNDVIYADVERLLIEPLDAKTELIPGTHYLIGNARLRWIIKHKSAEFNQQTISRCGQT